jgi:hypothetical protein
MHGRRLDVLVAVVALASADPGHPRPPDRSTGGRDHWDTSASRRHAARALVPGRPELPGVKVDVVTVGSLDERLEARILREAQPLP